jgi:pimeloyl-ACP methyl ester carboxylesterase
VGSTFTPHTAAARARALPRRARPDAAAVERALDEAGFETAHVAGNSLGGYLALKLAERGRARSVVALPPGGGWPLDPERIACPLRIVWGTADRLLPWPRAAERYRAMFTAP